MWKKITDPKRTASVYKGIITMMYDDGWEDILDCRFSCESDAAAIEHLKSTGWVEYDPNAELKAAGFVWNGSNYVKP